MFNKSIAYRLSIYISLAVVGVFIAFIILTSVYNSRIIKENIKNKAIGLSSEVIMKVEKNLIMTSEISSNIAQQILFYNQHDNAELLISTFMEKHQLLNAIHVNIDSGVPSFNFHNYYSYRASDSIIFEKSNNKHQCLNSKTIFEKVTISNNPGWTEVFRCPNNGNMVVSYYSPILVNNGNTIKRIGEVICELSLIDLNDTINNIKIRENGYAFLMSREGLYLTHPNEDLVFTQNVFSLSDEIYNKKETNTKEVLDKGLTGSLIAYPEYLNFEKSWVYYTPIKETGWTVVFVMPYDELFKPLYLKLLRMLFFSALGILIIYLIVSYISNKLVEPLSEITSQLKNFSNLSGDFELNTLNEVQLVSESLNFLKSWYEKFKIHQNREVNRNHLRRQDLIEASEIQQSLIKTDFSDFSKNIDIDLFAIYKPVRIVSGDLYDYFLLDNENVIFTVGDVSGKGVSAAFFMSVAQTIIKSNALYKRAKKIVNLSNNELYTNNQHQFFLTLFLGVLNLKTGVLNYCNAAHTFTYILKLNGEIIELNESHGLPLGLYPDKKYSDSKITLEAGDSIVLYTDGVTEQRNENKRQFGNENFKRSLSQLGSFSPNNMIKRIEKNLDLFRGKASQIDDITIMVIKYKGIKKA